MPTGTTRTAGTAGATRTALLRAPGLLREDRGSRGTRLLERLGRPTGTGAAAGPRTTRARTAGTTATGATEAAGARQTGTAGAAQAGAARSTRRRSGRRGNRS
jgi:hypothetical protein